MRLKSCHFSTQQCDTAEVPSQAYSTKIFPWTHCKLFQWEYWKFTVRMLLLFLFGAAVCMWEILSYGVKPFSNIQNDQVIELLERGERLSQPVTSITSLYSLMCSCWYYQPEERPHFWDIKIRLKYDIQICLLTYLLQAKTTGWRSFYNILLSLYEKISDLGFGGHFETWWDVM